MSIEDLKERVLVQTRATVPDQMGGYRITWANNRELWASVKPLTLKVVAESTEDLAAQRYHVKWRAGISVPRTARLVWRGMSLRFISQPQEDIGRRWTRAIAQAEGG